MVRRRFGAAVYVVVLLLLPSGIAAAEVPTQTGFVQRVFRDDAGEHRYVVYVPRNYTPDRPWPVMLFLHGAGERGTDGVRQSEAALGAMIRRWGEFPWVVVFPQAEDERGPIKTVWAPDAPDGRRALAILDEVERDYAIDPNHRVLTGWSMGGRGAYMQAAAFPEKWSAVLVVAGWADLDLAQKLRNVPLWSFHGTGDSLVNFSEDEALIKRIRDVGGSPLFTVMPDRGHYIWRTIFASPIVFEWMSNPAKFADRKDPPELNPLPNVEMSRDEAYGPFVPGIEMHNAIAVRIGPDMFRDLSYQASQEMAQKPMTGTMAGSTTRSQAGPISFKVTTSRMSYEVPVQSVDVVPTAAGSLCIRVTVANAKLTVGRTDVKGLICSATAGPMCIVLGHRSPIVVDIEAVPYLQGEKFCARTKDVRFSIPHDNWFVTRPYVDSHNPVFLPSKKVSQSLVEGAYSSKGRIENDFRRAVAEAIDEMKLELPPVSDDQLLTALWPVPAYRPRIRPRAEHVTVDEDGLAVVFGMTVAALDPARGVPVVKSIDFGLRAEHVAQGDLAIAAAEGLLEPLTRQLIEAGVAHVNVLDIPNGEFSQFADRETLTDAIPSLATLPATAEIRAELYMRKPLGLSETEEPVQACDLHGCFTIFGLHAKELAAVISVRDTPSAPWRDYVEFSYEVKQSLRLEIGQELADARQVISELEGDPDVRTAGKWLTPQPGDALDLDAATRIFKRGWNEWASVAEPTGMAVPDLQLKGYRRRLDRLEPGPRGMAAVFEEPETVLKNASDVPLRYRTRRPEGTWGPVLTLPSGERHVFRISRPLGYESEANGQSERWEIPAGRDATFKSIGDAPPGLYLDPLPRALRSLESVPGTGN
ncbi:MAG: hypothetical protein H0T47_07530 [Planctomycetaceae bacterium]|nr:hypothetical protein [Planctomycetaceae bacterium]